MEGQEMLDGLQVSPDHVPKFQAYLRQQLVFEHQRRRLQRSKRAWMCTALTAFLLVGFGLAQPGIPLRAHYALFPGGTGGIEEQFASLSRSPSAQAATEVAPPIGSLSRTLAASLEQDRMLAEEYGGLSERSNETLPERAFMVSTFPISGGREMEIYTPLPSDARQNVAFASHGGVW